MANRIILLNPPTQQGRGQLAKDVNKVIKQHRNKSRPFMLVMVEEGGEVTVASNMDLHHERIDLLTQVAKGLRNMN